MDNILDSVTLRKLQLVQLEILIEFDRICKKHNIKYQLYSGTLLGAVRHKGFIPWDDDVDICMLRSDYERILNILSIELDKKFFLQTCNTDKGYIHSFARIRKNNTLMLQKTWKDMDMHHGIFIDIFPMDNVIPDTLKGKIHSNLVYTIRKLKWLKIKKECVLSNKLYKKYIKLFIHYLLKPISLRMINTIETKIASLFVNKNTEYSTHLSEGTKIYYYKYLINNNEFYDTIEMEFEGHLFSVPRNYDKILTNNFGDYMTLPPLEQQKPHHGIIEICFDTNSKVE